MNGDFDMFYVDVDSDPNTYNSSRAEVRLPEGARATYARLYWGGNLRVGEQKPPKDDGRVLIAEPGGDYKAVLADTVVGHRVAGGADAFQASADVTKLVRDSGSGLYTVAQVNTAMGRSAAYARGAAGHWSSRTRSRRSRYGGWSCGTASTHSAPVTARNSACAGCVCPRTPGTRRRGGVQRGSRPHRGFAHPLDRAYERHRARRRRQPRDDVLNSTISDPAAASVERAPAYANTLGYDSDVFDLGKALRPGGDQLAFRLVSHRDAAWFGALFVAVDAQQ